MSDYFHESMVAKMVSSNEYQQGYSVGFASGYNQGRAEAIDEYKKKIEFEHRWLLDCKVFDTNVDLAFKTLKCYAEQLKKGNE